MKKDKKKVEDALQAVRNIQNTLSGNAREFADAVVGALETLEASEEEHDLDEVLAEIDRLKADAQKNRDTDREDVANKLQAIKNELAKVMTGGEVKKNQLTKKVANEVAKAILNSNGKDAVADSVKAVLKRNGIEGFTAAEITDWAVELKIENLNPLWRQFHKTAYNTWYYNATDMLNSANTIAKQHKKGTTKVSQEIEVTKKQIATDYIYKLQQIAFKDLDDIEEAGGLSEFLQMISNELYQMIVDTIVQYILQGETANEGTNYEITTFESVQNAAAAFVTKVTYNQRELIGYLQGLKFDITDVPTLVAQDANAAIAAIRYTSDQVWNPRSKHKVAIMSGAMLTRISAYRYSENGDLLFRSREEVAAQIGVDEIMLSDLMGGDVTIMLPDGYWVKEVKSIDVAYPVYEKNTRNFQKEINAGGAFHDILSCATILIQ